MRIGRQLSHRLGAVSISSSWPQRSTTLHRWRGTSLSRESLLVSKPEIVGIRWRRTRLVRDPRSTLVRHDAFAEAASRAPEGARVWCDRLTELDRGTVVNLIDRVPEERMLAPVKEFVVRMISFNRERLLNTCEDL
jgi:hypothetical protein